MRIVGDNTKQQREAGKTAIRTAIDAGYNHFDLADVYGNGQSECLFGEVLAELATASPDVRDKLIITSKAGIRAPSQTTNSPGHYYFSKSQVIESVEGSLQRLNIEALDIFLIHRPDYLLVAEEVAETFEILKTTGKVKNFGVSNFKPSQLELLRSVLTIPLVANQVEINIHNINPLLDGTLDQCQQYHIAPLAWCPLGGVAYPAWGNTFTADDQLRINNELGSQADKYYCEMEQVILAWLLRHPASILPIIGSVSPERIIAAIKALDIDYSREDWYRLLEARNGQPVP
jgi:predicted oxidoreductase